jgi:hypothetical protein
MWLIYKQMDMLGHQDIPSDDELISNARCLKFSLEDTVAAAARQQRKSVVATEGDEMETAGIVESNESPRHCGWILRQV